MNKDKIRWGIVGPGNIAHEFARDMQFAEKAELVAVASRNADRARQFSEKYNIDRYYGNYAGLYADEAIDAVYVATPHTFHLPNSSAALMAGKAVLCEKPLTHNLKDTTALLKLAKDKDIYLMEGMWTWFLPSILKAQQWVNEGRIGDIRHIKADFGFPFKYDPAARAFNPDLAGGCLLDIGCYNLAIAQLFLKQEPGEIHVIARKAPNNVDADVSMLFEYEEAAASLNASFQVKLHNHAYIIGEKGYIAIPDFWRASECFLHAGEKIVDRFRDEREGFGFNFEIDAVSSDLLAGRKASQVVSHEDSLKLSGTMDRVMRQFG
jgi:predicted dehydrogenase